MEITEKINAVVNARDKLRQATELRTSAYQEWLDKNQPLLDNEKLAKETCQTAEENLRTAALASHLATGEKTIAPGVNIRVMSCLAYDKEKAMDWAMEHKLAIKLDTPAFEKIAKVGNLAFVSFLEEPQATIATKLLPVEGEK